MKKHYKRLLSVLICVMILISTMTGTVLAAKKAKGKTKKELYKVFQKKTKSENKLRFIYDDFDNDGKCEAFGITGDEGEYVIENVRIIFISSDGKAKIVAKKDDLYGWIDDDGNEIIKTGTDKFLHWRLSAGGPFELSYLFGVKKGKVFEPKISRKYEMFSKSTKKKGMFVGYKSEYGNNGGHGYKAYYFKYNKKKHEFVKKT